MSEKYKKGKNNTMPNGYGLAALPALLAMSIAAHAADWVPLGADARGNAWHINMDSIAKDSDTVTAWKRVEFRQEHPHFHNGAPIKRAFLLGATNCVQRRTNVNAIGLLDPEGSVVAVYERSEKNNIQWPQGTSAALLDNAMSLVCARAERQLHQVTR